MRLTRDNMIPLTIGCIGIVVACSSQVKTASPVELDGATGNSGSSGGDANVGTGGSRNDAGNIGSGGGEATGGIFGFGGNANRGGSLGGGGVGETDRGTGGAVVGSGGSGGAQRGSVDGGAGSSGGGGTGADGAVSSNGPGGAGGDMGLVAYNPCPPKGQPCRVLPLGDSITFGVNFPGSYRVELFHRALQNAKSVTFVGSQANGPVAVDGVTFPQNHEGHSGYTIDDATFIDPTQPVPLQTRIGIYPSVREWIATFHPDVITMMIGTNDIQHGIDTANAPTRLGALMDRIVTADPHILLIVSKVTPTQTESLNIAMQAFNEQIATLVRTNAAAGKHVMLADMYTALARVSGYQTQLLGDNLHPNQAGYTVMGDAWYTVLSPLLR